MGDARVLSGPSSSRKFLTSRGVTCPHVHSLPPESLFRCRLESPSPSRSSSRASTGGPNGREVRSGSVRRSNPGFGSKDPLRFSSCGNSGVLFGLGVPGYPQDRPNLLGNSSVLPHTPRPVPRDLSTNKRSDNVDPGSRRRAAYGAWPRGYCTNRWTAHANCGYYGFWCFWYRGHR